MKNFFLFQGVFLPLIDFQAFSDLVPEPLSVLICDQTIERYSKNQALSFSDTCQIIHAVNLAKYFSYRSTRSSMNEPLFSGYSVGIYSALVASGYLDEKLSFEFIRERARILEKAAQDQWDMYVLVGILIEKVQELCAGPLLGQAYISTISTNRHCVLTIRRTNFVFIDQKFSCLGYFKFFLYFKNAAWHTPVIRSYFPELKALYQCIPITLRCDNVLFSQEGSDPLNLQERLLQDCFSPVDWRSIVFFAQRVKANPIFFDETDSLEKMWYANVKNNGYEVVKCVL